MPPSVPMSVRLTQETKDRLSRLSEATARSQAALAAEAIEAFVDQNEWQVARSKEALAAADSGGPFVAHDEMAAWLESWGTPDEKPVPDAPVRRRS
ncbi:MAG: CopG family ribbon-helix-helix protein [Magnetospiraceae bacterium]